MAYRKTLFETFKGKRMHAEGTWKTTKSEDLLIKGVAVFFCGKRDSGTAVISSGNKSGDHSVSHLSGDILYRNVCGDVWDRIHEGPKRTAG